MSVDSSSFHEEFFGPVFNLFRGGSAEECLKLANHSDYGLAGTIFTKDVAKAQDLGLRLDVGTVAINEMVASYSDMPSGGIKQSGYGKECHREGIVEIGIQKAIVQ